MIGSFSDNKMVPVKVLFLLCLWLTSIDGALSPEELVDLTDTCCSHGETFAISSSSPTCSSATLPDDLETEEEQPCRDAVQSCCTKYLKQKSDCTAGLKFAETKRCGVPKTDIGKTCCEECSLGKWTGESQGRESCGDAVETDVSPTTALRKSAFHRCCLEAANKPETTTKKVATTTPKRPTTTTEKRESCAQNNFCAQICNDDFGRISCRCREGYRLQADKKSCRDINECAEAVDDLCTAEGTVCHNVPGTFKCVPLKKRDTGHRCPPGFVMDKALNVCNDINECQLPRPPCPKYLCVNTIGGYKCAGKPGKPLDSEAPGAVPLPASSQNGAGMDKNNLCPKGFRSGDDMECIDIDECTEKLDDCNRLSQYCINSHGSFFCQDHVSKRCAPGFKANRISGVCEDIDECGDDGVCRQSEVCVNLPGAYDCKSKLSTLPKLQPSTSCQEGLRMRPGTTVCEDIDECREGNHLCDQFQNCINTYGGHECRCKSGYELDVQSGACVDIDECALKLDNCSQGRYCLNVLGSFTCTRTAPPVASSTHSPQEYEYYYSEEEDGVEEADKPDKSKAEPSSPTSKPPATTTKPAPRRTVQRTTNNVQPATTQKIYPTSPNTEAPTTQIKQTTPVTIPTTQKPVSTTPAVSSTPKQVPATPKPIPTTPKTVLTTPKQIPTAPRQNVPSSPKPYIPRNRNPTINSVYRNPYRPPSNYPPPTYLPAVVSSTTQRPQPYTNQPERKPQVSFVDIEVPKESDVIEKEKGPNDTYNIDPDEIPKNKWTNFIGKEPDFDQVPCLNGYERNSEGECVDIDECFTRRHSCSAQERCRNTRGGYSCECERDYWRDETGWCVPTPAITTPPPLTPTLPPPPALVPPPPPALPPSPPTLSSPSARPTPRPYPYQPKPNPPRWSWGKPTTPPTSTLCDIGYEYEDRGQKCVDIDECMTNRANCGPNERCVNTDGGYKCVPAFSRPRADVPATLPAPYGPNPTPSTIAVGAQYGQRGPKYMYPTRSRLADYGALLVSCPKGYTLSSDKMCADVDECSANATICGEQLTCENFFGGYSCTCPAGHQLVGRDNCVDINECAYGNPCSVNAECVNTPGSFRCSCLDGFRSSANSEQICIDVDECSEQAGRYSHDCVNVWGGFRCTCRKGYKLASDNTTCEDIDECSAVSQSGAARSRLCAGECVNSPGSYSCQCPAGYTLAHDNYNCVDINECESGQADCAYEPEAVCVNTRGSYHCHRIECPTGYRLEGKHRCVRIQRSCLLSDWECLRKPYAYSYNFVTLPSGMRVAVEGVDLFTMYSESRSDLPQFELNLVKAEAPTHARAADLACFNPRPSGNTCAVSLLCSLAGPQVVELELTMSVHRMGQFVGSTVARLVVIVSQYEF